MKPQANSGPIYQPEWLQGRGVGPRLLWSRGTEGPITAAALARETGELIVADASPALYRIGPDGQIRAKAPLRSRIQSLVWADDGSAGAAVAGQSLVIRFDRDLQFDFTLDLPDTCVGLGIAPFGNHLAIAQAGGVNLIYNERKRRLAQFQTLRPLAFLKFCATEPLLYAAAEHGLLCCHDLQGGEVWQERMWSNVGALEITGDGDLLYLAGFAHGVQVFDGDGGTVGSYVLEGTVNRIGVSYEPQRLLAATIERGLFWLDSDGEMLWTTTVPDDLVSIHCDPLGEWAVIGMAELGLFHISWAG